MARTGATHPQWLRIQETHESRRKCQKCQKHRRMGYSSRFKSTHVHVENIFGETANLSAGHLRSGKTGHKPHGEAPRGRVSSPPLLDLYREHVKQNTVCVVFSTWKIESKLISKNKCVIIEFLFVRGRPAVVKECPGGAGGAGGAWSPQGGGSAGPRGHSNQTRLDADFTAQRKTMPRKPEFSVKVSNQIN